MTNLHLALADTLLRQLILTRRRGMNPIEHRRNG